MDDIKTVHDNLVTASVTFRHGIITVTGTTIFARTKIVDLQKEEGWLATDNGATLNAVLDRAAERQRARDRVAFKEAN